MDTIMGRFFLSMTFLSCLCLLQFRGLEVFAASVSPVGTWLDQSERGAIEIKPCGDKLCGHLVWIRDLEGGDGCGLQIIGGARQIKDGLWDDGWIYSPEKNRKYDVELKPLSDGRLRVKGYAGSKIFSRTMIWTPAPKDLELCHTTEKNSSPSQNASRGDKLSSPRSEKIAAIAPQPSTQDRSALSPSQGEINSESNNTSVQTPQSSKEASKTEDSPSPLPTRKKERLVKEDRKGRPKTAFSDIDSSSSGQVMGKLAQLQKQTGFGVTKIGDGVCKLKVPFVTVRIRCD